MKPSRLSNAASLVSWPEPPHLPSLQIPEHYPLPAVPTLEAPEVELPKHPPLVVPPSDLRPPPGVSNDDVKNNDEGDKNEVPKENTFTPSLPKETQMIEVPFTDVEVPIPTTEIMTTAATTAVISVAATLTATSIFKWLVAAFKPLFKQTWNKLTKRNNHQHHEAS